MSEAVHQSKVTSLCRFSLKEEHLVQQSEVKRSIADAFADKRAFPFYADLSAVEALKSGSTVERMRWRFIEIKNAVFDEISANDASFRNRLSSDTRLADRITDAIALIHRSLAEGEFSTLGVRRFVVLKELPGKPTFHHISDETTVISHVGGGPAWKEMASIYLGLKTLDMISSEEIKGEHHLFESFLKLLSVEERAIETGFVHIETYPSDFFRALYSIVEGVIAYSNQAEVEVVEEPVKKEEKVFTKKTRESYLKLLDARHDHDMMNFDYEKCEKGLHGLERLAKRYKREGNENSLHEIVRLLVSASGHDIHEIRNRANVILERVFSPKEFDAPPATTFFNIHEGESLNLEFNLPENDSGYTVRIYRNSAKGRLITEPEIDVTEYPLEFNEKKKRYAAKIDFPHYGHFDFAAVSRKSSKIEWITEHGANGRINVLPDLRGEIVIEVFTDIHGHSRLYWRDESGHPGLVYNENGEIIRLGKFSDISAHLEDMKERYSLTALYILGVQKRGSNRGDWAPEATSPSPFSPMSLVEIEPSLGGEEEFKELVSHAHKLGIKIIVDIIPHVNRASIELPDEDIVYCYDHEGGLYPRASTDGRYGSWNDGKLLNYRRFEVWEWLVNSVLTLIKKFDIDGIRFDSAHAVPIMMKRNNFPMIYDKNRSHEDMVEGRIIVNDRWDEHYITTGYFDCQCRDSIAIPFHYYMMLRIERTLREVKKSFFINIAECFWGHERFLSRSGIVPYNASLFKINENIIHGKSDVREIYHIYDNYYPSVLCSGTELLGILGNHDERRALNTFGDRGLRAAVTLTSFMSNIIMDFEGSAEGEGWKVFLDNIYVNWNQFEFAANRSLSGFYADIYAMHRKLRGRGYLIWANNHMVAAAMKAVSDDFWIAICNYSDSSQQASLQFDNPVLPIKDDCRYRLVDLIYSPITNHYNYYTGRELKVSRINTTVPNTERFKLLRLEKVRDADALYSEFLSDSFYRICTISHTGKFTDHFAYQEIISRIGDFRELERFLSETLLPLFDGDHTDFLDLGLKRCFYRMFRDHEAKGAEIFALFERMKASGNPLIAKTGATLKLHNRKGPWVFMSAEADPFSKSGGLANVVYELPRELSRAGEETYVITPMYRTGDPKAVERMRSAIRKYGVTYTGKNVHFMVGGNHYEAGVHKGIVNGVTYFLLDHYELFDGLYWGYTAEEKLRRRLGFARASAEVICTFGLKPAFTLTNDAFTGPFNGIVRSDHTYYSNPNFKHTTFLHVIHNGGWQYFDAFSRWENGWDLFSLVNLPQWQSYNFMDPCHGDRINCMASGIRFADRTFTVSPSYARQIEYQSDGLEHILHNVIGISNAIGSDFLQGIRHRFEETHFEERNYPLLMSTIKHDRVLKKKISLRYPEILEGARAPYEIADPERRAITVRMLNKLMLQCEQGLDADPDKILAVMIHRVTEQKGFQLLLEASEGIVNTLGYQIIAGGGVASGDRRGDELANGLWQISQNFRRSVHVTFGFLDVSVPLLSCDVFIMPSLSEPGGISQLEALACGALVVARATGGLRDTVFPLVKEGDEIRGNGFLFTDYTSRAFYDAMERAAKFLKENDDATVQKARTNAEKSIYYWDKPARQYIDRCYDLKEVIRIVE
jgi:starch synthase